MNENIKKLNRLTSAGLDLENCLRFLDEANNHNYGSIVCEGLLFTSIILYIRPFSSNELKDSKNPSDQRVSEEVLYCLDKSELEVHEKLYQLRNKALAHAEFSYHPTGVTEGKIIKANHFSVFKHFKNSNDFNQFRSIVVKVLNSIHVHKMNVLNKL